MNKVTHLEQLHPVDIFRFDENSSLFGLQILYLWPGCNNRFDAMLRAMMCYNSCTCNVLCSMILSNDSTSWNILSVDKRNTSKLWFVSWFPLNSTPHSKMSYTVSKQGCFFNWYLICSLYHAWELREIMNICKIVPTSSSSYPWFSHMVPTSDVVPTKSTLFESFQFMFILCFIHVTF